MIPNFRPFRSISLRLRRYGRFGVSALLGKKNKKWFLPSTPKIDFAIGWSQIFVPFALSLTVKEIWAILYYMFRWLVTWPGVKVHFFRWRLGTYACDPSFFSIFRARYRNTTYRNMNFNPKNPFFGNLSIGRIDLTCWTFVWLNLTTHYMFEDIWLVHS